MTARDPHYRQPSLFEWGFIILVGIALLVGSYYWAEGWQHYYGDSLRGPHQ